MLAEREFVLSRDRNERPVLARNRKHGLHRGCGEGQWVLLCCGC
jgi:hypothetical protein